MSHKKKKMSDLRQLEHESGLPVEICICQESGAYVLPGGFKTKNESYAVGQMMRAAIQNAGYRIKKMDGV